MAANQIDDVFIAGIYFTVFPNLLVSTFPRYLLALHLTPLSPTRTRVQAYRFWTADVPDARRDADLAASQEVAAQDLDICGGSSGATGRRRYERTALGRSEPAYARSTNSCGPLSADRPRRPALAAARDGPPPRVVARPRTATARWPRTPKRKSWCP